MNLIKRFFGALTLGFLVCAGIVASAQTQSAPPPPPPPVARAVMFIDAAHGGEDSGAQLENGALEKTVSLAISVRLRSLLAARGIAVVTTRESDATIDVNRRVELANRSGAEACVSIHATASGVGIHLFTSSLAPGAQTKFAPWKTAQSAWVLQSLALAGVVNSTLQQAGFTVSSARTNLPGIDSMTCPAIAVELATPTAENGNEPALLTDPAYQAHVAEALATALIEWRAEARRQ